MNISLKGNVRLKVFPTRLSTPIRWNSTFCFHFVLKK